MILRYEAALLVALTFCLCQSDCNEHADRSDREDDGGLKGHDLHYQKLNKPMEYGVDVSFPMHYPKVSTNYPWLPHNNQSNPARIPDEYKDMPIQPLGNKEQAYREFLQGCIDLDGRALCQEYEKERITNMRKRTPFMLNYTSTGYYKMRAPDHLWRLVKEFWDENKEDQKLEGKVPGSTYRNSWKSPTYMVRVVDKELRQALHDAAYDPLAAWSGQELRPSSLYGVRVYTNGAILAPHVDSLHLVISAIVNVAQDVDEPWPLEVIGHDGKAHNITMVPGDMILYESHSIIHGRPFELKGRFLANLFIHFEPTGRLLSQNEGLNPRQHEMDQAFRDTVKQLQPGYETPDDDLPVQVLR